MATYTLESGKVVETKELGAYQSYMMSSFITGTINAEAAQEGEIPAAFAVQMNTLKTLFSVDKVNGREVKMPTNKKELAKAFSYFTDKEFTELQKLMNEDEKSDEEGKSNSGEVSNGSLNASKSGDGATDQ